MRAANACVALALLIAAAPFLAFDARAGDPPRLEMTVEAGVGDKFIFDPAQIILPFVPIVLNITLVYNGTATQGFHTFSIRDNAATTRIDIRVDAPGDRAYTEFTMASATQVTYGGQTFTAEAVSGGVKFFCAPHEALGMVGAIIVGGVSGPATENTGMVIRAYWIGLIGLGAMLAWIVITYFLVKTSSRHFRDAKEHIRRGLT